MTAQKLQKLAMYASWNVIIKCKVYWKCIRYRSNDKAASIRGTKWFRVFHDFKCVSFSYTKPFKVILCCFWFFVCLFVSAEIYSLYGPSHPLNICFTNFSKPYTHIPITISIPFHRQMLIYMYIYIYKLSIWMCSGNGTQETHVHTKNSRKS